MSRFLNISIILFDVDEQWALEEKLLKMLASVRREGEGHHIPETVYKNIAAVMSTVPKSGLLGVYGKLAAVPHIKKMFLRNAEELLATARAVDLRLRLRKEKVEAHPDVMEKMAKRKLKIEENARRKEVENDVYSSVG